MSAYLYRALKVATVFIITAITGFWAGMYVGLGNMRSSNELDEAAS